MARDERRDQHEQHVDGGARAHRGDDRDALRRIGDEPSRLLVQTGQELAAALATGDAEGKSPEQLRQAQTGQLVDTFIRQPTQMINFGQVLDGGKCEGAYNDVVKGGPYGNESDIRDKISDCDNTLGEYAANPSASMALGSIVFFPAAFVILAMCMLLGGSVIAAAVWAMFQSLKAIVTFVTGLLPGGGRGSLMLTAAETIVRWPSVRRGELRHIFPFRPNVDMVFDSSLVYEMSVLKTYAERYLLEVPEDHPAFTTAFRLRNLIDQFVAIHPDHVPPTSVLREFIGGSGFEY